MKRSCKRFTMLSILLAGLSLLAACGGGGGGGTSGGPTPAVPGAFNLISPADNDTASTMPTLSWNPAAGATSYTVEIDLASNPSFTSLVYHITTANDTVSGVTLTAGTSYIWRVIAVNSGGATISSGANTFTVNNKGAVVWTVTSNPTGTGAEAFGMAVDGGSLYVVGYDTTTSFTDDQWRIEKRSVADGALTPGFGANGVVTSNPSGASAASFDDAYGIVTDGTSLYAVGFDSGGVGGNERWRIEKRSLSNGALDTVTPFGAGGVVVSANTGTYNEAFAVARDTTSLYVAGYDTDASGNEQWRIEKRNLTSGALDTTTPFGSGGVVTSATGTRLNEAMAIAVDSGSGYMYVAGFDSSLGRTNTEWRIEKRKLSDGSLDTTTPFGTNGVVTSNPSNGNDIPTSLVIDSGFMYITGYQAKYSAATSTYYDEWRIEKRSLSDGKLDASFGTGGVVTSDPNRANDDVPWAVGIDSTGLYVAGYDTGASGVKEWRIEKRTK